MCRREKNTQRCRGTAGSFPFLALTAEINHYNYGPAPVSRDRSLLSLPSSRCFPIVWVSSAFELQRGQWALHVPWVSVKHEQTSSSCVNLKESCSNPRKCLNVMTEMSVDDVSPRFQSSTSSTEASLYPFVSLTIFFYPFPFLFHPHFPLPYSLLWGWVG